MITATLHTSGQFAVRLVVLLLTSLVALSIALDLDMLLGAFAAGVIAKLLLADATPHDAEIIEGKLEAVGFGFFVPVFFINTGVTFDLQALLSSTTGAAAAAGVPGPAVAGPRAAGAAQRADRLRSARTSGPSCCSRATGLPIIVAVTGIGVESGDLRAGTASALVGAGMLSVLLFPLLALGQHRKAADGAPKPPDHGPCDRRGGLTRGRPGTVEGDS